MANDAAGLSWDTNAPALSDDRRDGAEEIRGLRAGVGLRINKEHFTLDAGTPPDEGGEHRPGSAVAFHEDGEPTDRPSPIATALDDQDDGRLLVDSTGSNETMKVWDGASLAWLAVTGVQIASGNILGSTFNAATSTPITLDLGFACDLFVIVVRVSTTSSFCYVAPLKDEAIVLRMIEGNFGATLHVSLERSGTDVLVLKGGDNSAANGENVSWMAFNFG